jgi:hypothetical protein
MGLLSTVRSRRSAPSQPGAVNRVAPPAEVPVPAGVIAPSPGMWDLHAARRYVAGDIDLTRLVQWCANDRVRALRAVETARMEAARLAPPFPLVGQQ